MIHRRPIALFSLSFLDCICCGFGAIILLFVLTIGSQDKALIEIRDTLQRILMSRLATVAEYRTTREDLQAKASARAEITAQITRQQDLQKMLDELDRQISYQEAGKQALLVEIDAVKKHIAALQKKPELRLKDVPPTPVGIPVGSNFLVFVIDTSGSMRDPNSGEFWPAIIPKIDQVMSSYPTVDGIQILDADGRFVLSRSRGEWLPDSPEVRAGLLQALQRYDIFSNSNPVPGIYQAITRLYQPDNADMKMGIYIIGDEFTGTADAVIRRLDELNPADEKGERKIVINAIGFPTAVRYQLSAGNTGLKYANLMREVTYQHGGAFVAVSDL